jgi:hypothetical protein
MSNADAISALRAEITAGWKVEIIDHFYISESRDDVTVVEVRADRMVLRPRKPWSSQGMSFPTMDFRWSGDLEIDGRTVTVYRTAKSTTSRSWVGQRQAVKTFVFTPPREY